MLEGSPSYSPWTLSREEPSMFSATASTTLPAMRVKHPVSYLSVLQIKHPSNVTWKRNQPLEPGPHIQLWPKQMMAIVWSSIFFGAVCFVAIGSGPWVMQHYYTWVDIQCLQLFFLFPFVQVLHEDIYMSPGPKSLSAEEASLSLRLLALSLVHKERSLIGLGERTRNTQHSAFPSFPLSLLLCKEPVPLLWALC